MMYGSIDSVGCEVLETIIQMAASRVHTSMSNFLYGFYDFFRHNHQTYSSMPL